MRSTTAICFVVFAISLVTADVAEWNDLSVTFRKFDDMPMTETLAKTEGWSLISDDCKDSGGPFVGRRYMLGGDHATILVFDVNGNIAGMQMAYLTTTHGESMKYSGAYTLIKEGENFFYYLTAYFRNPKTICDESVGSNDGTIGDRLVFYAGKNEQGKDTFIEAPLTQDAAVGTKWVMGSCFSFMGVHYWYDINEGMECEDFFPYFLLYNKWKGHLVGWGFATRGMVESPRLEHPPPFATKYFFKKGSQPKCFKEQKAFSTQHVYFSKVGWFSHNCVLGSLLG